MTQGAGQEPVVRTATLRDFRVPPYARVPVQGHAPEPLPTDTPPSAAPTAGPADATLHLAQAPEAYEPRVAYESTEPYESSEPYESPAPYESPEPYDFFAAGAVSAGHPGHPGNAFPDDEPPEGYTPTERDLPVINRGDTVQVHVAPVPQPAAAARPDGRGPMYVVGDVHGYLDELLEALRAQGIIDENGGWAAGNTRLWFLGDFTDRGPDGIGVIDLVMRLSAEAAAAGGYCKALMGNHELLLIGAKRFGDTPVSSGAGTATFQAAWLLNGGQKHDMDRLQDVHIQWMSRLDSMAEEDGHLLLHSDTTAYLEYGDTIEDVNETVKETLNRNDADEVWDLFRKFTKRFAFRDEEAGPPAVREMLGTYGGSRIVHGHSPIPYLLGQVGTEDGEEGERPLVEGPHVYADGLAIAMDGGVTMAGKLLVVQLPLPA
ncbi:metallophosphoesterase [Streptomyces sp. NPDC004788]